MMIVCKCDFKRASRFSSLTTMTSIPGNGFIPPPPMGHMLDRFLYLLLAFLILYARTDTLGETNSTFVSNEGWLGSPFDPTPTPKPLPESPELPLPLESLLLSRFFHRV